MFLDVSEQVFILVFDVWMRFRENREKSQRVLILVTAFAYKFIELIRNGCYQNQYSLYFFAIFGISVISSIFRDVGIFRYFRGLP